MKIIKPILQKNSQAGFSLIELMVVVAIIGILATIAVPQFTKMMAKARQSEAKSLLASLYTAEKAFYVEYSIFNGMFGVIGWAPEGNIRYNVGFVAAPATPPANTGIANLTAPRNAGTTVAFCPNSSGSCTIINGVTGAPAGPYCSGPSTNCVDPNNGSTFSAGASAVVYSPDGTTGTYDIWTINQLKALSNVQPGI